MSAKRHRSARRVKSTNPLVATIFALSGAVLLLVLLSCCAAAEAAVNAEDPLTFNREDRGDYRPLQFGKRGDFRPLQFGKKNSYRPLQFGKRGILSEYGGGEFSRNGAFNGGGGDVEFF